MSYVEIRELTKRFDTTTVFENINLDVDEGKICVLVGPSGCARPRCCAPWPASPNPTAEKSGSTSAT